MKEKTVAVKKEEPVRFCGMKPRCQAADDRVCYMIRYGEHPDFNPRCSCLCHALEKAAQR